MVIKKYILIIFICLGSTNVFAQRLIGYVSTNMNSAYVGQPVELTVSVYTSTWFTAGIDIGNIQIEGAFSVYFRSVTSTKEFQGKNHAGVEFLYNIYPNKAGELEIPELSIHVVSPKPDDYKGIPQIIKTQSKTIKINDVPLGQNPNKWLVTTNLNVTQNWSTRINSLKVGDVIKRTITQNVSNTVSEFIPPINWDSIQGVSNYVGRASVQTNKSKTNVSGKRIETIQYLFEEAGEVLIPKIEFNYWNPRTKKYHQKVIPERKLVIAENDNLEMLLSAKEKLKAETISINEEDESDQFLIFGMTIRQLFKWLLFILIGFLIIIKFYKYFRRIYLKKKKRYVQSELKAFKNILKSIDSKSNVGIINNSHIWLLKLDIINKNMDSYIFNFGTETLKNEIEIVRNMFYSKNSSSSTIDYRILKKEIINSRKNYFKTYRVKNNANKIISLNWLNPVQIK